MKNVIVENGARERSHNSVSIITEEDKKAPRILARRITFDDSLDPTVSGRGSVQNAAISRYRGGAFVETVKIRSSDFDRWWSGTRILQREGCDGATSKTDWLRLGSARLDSTHLDCLALQSSRERKLTLRSRGPLRSPPAITDRLFACFLEPGCSLASEYLASPLARLPAPPFVPPFRGRTLELDVFLCSGSL